jgi:RHH-type proline utilization regulon transcriptional repressor/proline dehydrogenase/delta 1-pyrroline-5-carboxylate dehydrogenase
VKLPPANETENSRNLVDNLIEKAVEAQSNWEVTTILQRNSVIRRFLSLLAENPGSFPEEQINDLLTSTNELIREAEINLAEAVTLPGPTGESNQLSLEGRGIVALVLDKGTQPTESLKLIFSALLAGNAVVTLAGQSLDRNMDNHINNFIRSGLPENMLARLPLESARLILTNPKIHCVLVPVASESVKDVRRLLATSEGALIPLIREHNHRRLLNRLVVEKTITIDTTAAGGNASLMAAAS